MAKKIKPKFLVAGAIIVGLILLLASGILPFGAQSIVSISDISVFGGGEVIQVTMAVNNADLVWFIPQENILSSGRHEFDDVTKDVRINFSRLGTECNAPLKESEISTIFGPIIFYESATSYRKDVITEVEVERANFASGVFDEFVGGVTFNACNTGNCELPVRNSVTFTTSDLGEINIENLGALDNGPQCPDAGEVAIIQTSSGLTAVDKDDFINRVQNQAFTTCLNLNTIPQCLDLWITGQISGFETLRFPDGHLDCPPFTSCVEQFEEPFNTTNLTYKLPSGSGTSIITANMNKEFVGAVVFQPSIVQPVIESVTMSPSTVKVGEQATLSISVRNNGDTGSVRVVPLVTIGKVSISPFEATEIVTSGEVRTYVFTVSGAVDGTETLNILVEGIGVGSGSDTRNFTFTVNPREGGICGDGVCNLGEQVTCPQDCVVEPPPREPVECAFWEKKVTIDSAFLVDFFGIKLFPTDSAQECQIDLIVVGLIAAIIILGVMIVSRMKKK